MTSTADPPPLPARFQRPSAWFAALALVAAFTVFVRSVYFGDPVVDADEDFYLLVGDRWLHGAVPYVDVWDRKPPGLFLLYASIRMLGGSGIIQYQLAAAVAASATAMLIAILARRIAGTLPAVGAALSYPLALGWSGGMGGQSPVFYNLPMAAAAMLILKLLSRSGGNGLAMRGAAAMLLVGIAMQIKYSALYEGIYFGLVLLWLARRRSDSWTRVASLGCLWIVAALAPTAVAFAGFALAGHGEAFIYANFTSILLRRNEPLAYQSFALAKMLGRLSPELLILMIGALLPDRPWAAHAGGTTARRFILGWVTASFLGILLFGNFFPHYALPLMVPLAIAIAPAFACRHWRVGASLAALVLVSNGVAYIAAWRHIVSRSGDRAYAERVTTIVRQHLHGGKLYVFNGEPILYYLTGSPLPTRWPFPYHLSWSREATALGVDPRREVTAIMAAGPTVVEDTYQPGDPEISVATEAIVRSRLARHYRLIASFPLRGRVRRIYARIS